MPIEKIISKPYYSSVLLKISLALFLFSVLSTPAQSQNETDSTSNGIYAEVQILFAQQIQIH